MSETRFLTEAEPDMSGWVGEAVVYRRGDGQRGLGTVEAYNRETGRYSIRAPQGWIVTRHWAGVGRA
jgi:hypothetical protein